MSRRELDPRRGGIRKCGCGGVRARRGPEPPHRAGETEERADFKRSYGPPDRRASLGSGFGEQAQEIVPIEAERLNLPLKVLVGADYREAVLREAETVKALFARHPWSSR